MSYYLRNSPELAGKARAKLRPHPFEWDMDRSPVIVFWETTRACALVCVHCRAEAQPKRHPLELTTQEGSRLLEELASFPQRPTVVLTGGDPFMRRDLFELVEHGLAAGLRVAVSPSATRLVTRPRLQRLRDAGISRISFSLDGSCAEVHDAFRGVRGSFDMTTRCIRDALDVGLSLQVHTTVTRRNVHDLPAVAGVVASLGALLWNVFFLVPTGRAREEDLVSPEEHERTWEWLADLAQEAPFDIKTTLGQQYRRVWLQRRLAAQGRTVAQATQEELLALWGGPPTNDGRGIMFISHLGEVYPSGFLPMSVGSVRTQSPVALYQESEVFRRLRDTALLKGKCGQCPFNVVCGGCRARAYAATGDYLESDPSCPFEPASVLAA